MARERMVTRTVLQTTAEVMCIEVTTAEVTVNSYTLGGTYEQDELLKKLKKIYETDTYKLVHIESVSTEELLLGMSESQFMEYATVLSTSTKKAGEK